MEFTYHKSSLIELGLLFKAPQVFLRKAAIIKKVHDIDIFILRQFFLLQLFPDFIKNNVNYPVLKVL